MTSLPVRHAKLPQISIKIRARDFSHVALDLKVTVLACGGICIFGCFKPCPDSVTLLLVVDAASGQTRCIVAIATNAKNFANNGVIDAAVSAVGEAVAHVIV